jgi:HD-like signal output (HDOD) protein
MIMGIRLLIGIIIGLIVAIFRLRKRMREEIEEFKEQNQKYADIIESLVKTKQWEERQNGYGDPFQHK